MVICTTDGEGTRRTRSAPATESLGGGCTVGRRRDGGRCPLGEATGVTVALNVRGEPEEEAVVHQGDAGHVPVCTPNHSVLKCVQYPLAYFVFNHMIIKNLI